MANYRQYSVNGGANWFGVEDIDAGTTPFTILASAPNASLYISSSGNIGLGTTTPLVELSIKSGDTPTVRLEQSTSSGFAEQAWDVGGNEATFLFVMLLMAVYYPLGSSQVRLIIVSISPLMVISVLKAPRPMASLM